MKKQNCAVFLMTLFFIMIITVTQAQNNISLLRYDDDFSIIKNDSNKNGLNQLKNISIGKSDYLSFGGEIREQYQNYNNLNFGDVPSTYKNISTNQLWHRLMLHSNIELGKHYRFFIQMNNTLRFLNENPIVPEIDENQLSLHQAFAEIKSKQWKFRIGRQELYYGNHRLLTVREGPNTRQAFDGLVIKKKFKNGVIDILVVSKVINNQYIFDDQSFKEGLVGIYGTQYLPNLKIGFDYYVVNFQSKLRKYNYLSGYENRQTYGLRLFSNMEKINFEFEGGYQSGDFNNLTINAYNVVADINMMIIPGKKGIIGFVANAASGDRNNTDNQLNTYNLLYAKPAYGLAVPIGASNIINLNPYVKINPVKKLNVLAEVFFLERNSDRDGTYSPGMLENRPKPMQVYSSTQKTLGELYVLETNYQLQKNVSFAFDASFFKAGNYITTTGNGKDVTYLSFRSTFKF